MTPNLTDAEIDDICAGLSQSAAKARFLMNLGLNVARKPNGAPLVNRAHYDRVMGISDKSSRSNEAEPQWTVR